MENLEIDFKYIVRIFILIDYMHEILFQIKFLFKLQFTFFSIGSVNTNAVKNDG